MPTTHGSSKLRSVAAAALVLSLVTAPGLVAAADDEIHACVKTVKKNVKVTRLVADPALCTKNGESSLTWSVVGPQGPQGDTGPKGDTGPQGETPDLGGMPVVISRTNDTTFMIPGDIPGLSTNSLAFRIADHAGVPQNLGAFMNLRVEGNFIDPSAVPGTHAIQNFKIGGVGTAIPITGRVDTSLVGTGLRGWSLEPTMEQACRAWSRT